jgi:TatD DNase family protein
MLVDSHCHLDFPDLAGRLPEVLARARAAGVSRMVTISTRVAHADSYRALSEAHEDVLFTIGTHPHNAGEEPDSPRDVQQRVFRAHIAAARESGLPLVIHAREADDEMIEILEDESGRGRFDAVLHCFSSGPELARVGVKLGFYVSFSGILTFKNSEELRRIAASMPRDRLLVETDAPYLAPVPHRGRVNEPAYVAHTAKVLAETIGISEAAVSEFTTANFYRLFAKAEAFRPADARLGPA